jgi:hypothetical protein
MRVYSGLAAAAMLMLGACGEDAPAPLDLTFKGMTSDQAQQLLGVFHTACPDLLLKYRADVVDATISGGRGFAEGYLHEQYGWRAEATLEVKLADTPGVIPKAFQAAGHTLHFTMGGGGAPGVVTPKAQATAVCGWPAPVNGANVHVAIPDMAVIDAVLASQVEEFETEAIAIRETRRRQAAGECSSDTRDC